MREKPSELANDKETNWSNEEAVSKEKSFLHSDSLSGGWFREVQKEGERREEKVNHSMRCRSTRFPEVAFIHTTVNLWPQQEIIHLGLKALTAKLLLQPFGCWWVILVWNAGLFWQARIHMTSPGPQNLLWTFQRHQVLSYRPGVGCRGWGGRGSMVLSKPSNSLWAYCIRSGCCQLAFWLTRWMSTGPGQAGLYDLLVGDVP